VGLSLPRTTNPERAEALLVGMNSPRSKSSRPRPGLLNKVYKGGRNA
jgi:hypothetical protein